MSDGVCVIGSGAWGTAIAKLLAEKGHGVWLWTFEPELAGIIRKKRENSWYLAGIKLPAGITPTDDLADAVRGSKAIICAVPSQFVRGVMEKAGEWIRPGALLVSATKGIEVHTLSRMSTIIAQAVPAGAARRLCVISGPSFAMEVARGFPTAVAVASRNHASASACQRLFNSPRFRVYTNDDMAGVELGGALKNVIAIAAGISDGLGFGNNARAALITRGIAEISRLGVAMGAHLHRGPEQEQDRGLKDRQGGVARRDTG
jgi:glycerol-3-phosphate dehydrogenase (NAD(P)+)